MELDKFTIAYIEAALWSTNDDNDTPLENNYNIEDISPETLEKIKNDCAKFQELNEEIYSETDYDREQFGHDFWFTRNHHGVGFWEADHCTKEQGEALTKSAQSFGESDLYVDDDGKLYI